MKFAKTYQEYMQGQKKPLPGVQLKKLKKILKKCRGEVQLQKNVNGVLNASTCPLQCPAPADPDAAYLADPIRSPHLADTKLTFMCDGTFFPSLLKEMSTIVGCFNEQAQKLLELHLESGFRKCFLWKGRNHVDLIQEGKDLVTYAMINSIAIRKILKKYDKIHYSKQGQAFKSQAQSMHIEILQSRWLCELMAFHVNLRETNAKMKAVSGIFGGCSLVLNDGKPSLCCAIFDSVKLDIDLTCSICLDTVFDPVSLTCGHIFCHMCACSAASVTIVDGLKAADPIAKCPLCREAGVFDGSIFMEELNILLSRSCHEYWEQRLQIERKERIKQAKEHWETQCRAFMGV